MEAIETFISDLECALRQKFAMVYLTYEITTGEFRLDLRLTAILDGKTKELTVPLTETLRKSASDIAEMVGADE
jgi:hypothetical protein